MSAFAAEMTWEEIREKAGATGVALVPAGSTERHGKHLPLGTDSATAAEVARRVGERTGAVVFPNLDYGVEEHPAFGGVFLDDATYAALVRDVCLGIERLGFDKILLISGHGPNNACIFRVIKELFRERPDRRYFGLAHCMTLINQLMPDFVAGRPVGHSDFRETSIMLAINEKLVYPEKASGPETLTQPFAGSLKSAGVHLIGQGGGSIHFCHALGELETHGGYGRVRGASRDRGGSRFVRPGRFSQRVGQGFDRPGARAVREDPAPHRRRGGNRRMSAELVVKNATLVLPESGPVACHFAVKDGRISAIGGAVGSPAGARILDLEGRPVLPGLVDPHVHTSWMPPLADRIRAESAFGISGGVTTFIRYLRHPASYLDRVDEQIELADRVHYQDYAFHLSLFNVAQVREIPRYVDRFGVTSFKLYTNMKGALGRGVLMDLRPGAREPDLHDVHFDASLLLEVFRTLERLPQRCRLNVHCEDGEVLAGGIDAVRRMGLDGLAAWHAACSDLAEGLAIGQVALLARAHRVPVYFPHIGSRAAVKALREARACGTQFVAETGPHYLALTTDCPAGVLAKVMPPIRTPDDQAAVWQALREGLIETIGSDHVAFTRAEKRPGDIWSTRPAFPGTGLMLPLLLSEGVARRRLSLQQLARITSYNSARAFGLYPRKGTLLPGSDADFVVVDPDRVWRIEARDLLSASDFSIYEGMAVTGAVDRVYVRGNEIFADGRLTGEAGCGKYLRRTG